MSFIAAAVIIGAGAVVGGAASVYGARQQAKSADKATALQSQQFGQTSQDLAPWMDVGQRALGQLDARILGKYNDLQKPFDLTRFHESPGYQFNLQQGQQALDKAANARGNYYAPQTLQDTAKFSQGLASNEFNNAYNQYNQNKQNQFQQLYSLSGSGQNAAAQTGAFGANFANNAGQNITGAGNAQAAGYVGAANSINQGIGQGYNAYLLNQILANNQGSMYSGAMSGGMAGLYGSPNQNPAAYVGLEP